MSLLFLKVRTTFVLYSPVALLKKVISTKVPNMNQDLQGISTADVKKYLEQFATYSLTNSTLRASEACTKKKACLTCFVIWIFAFGLTSPILATIEYSNEDMQCLTQVNTYWPKFYIIFLITVFFFIPLIILIWLYLKIARNLVPSPSTGVIDHNDQVMLLKSQTI